ESPGSPWLVLFDGGGSAATPVDDLATAEKFLSQAPASCPARWALFARNDLIRSRLAYSCCVFSERDIGWPFSPFCARRDKRLLRGNSILFRFIRIEAAIQAIESALPRAKNSRQRT